MSRVVIIRPLAAAIAGNMTSPERMATPDPKEVSISPDAGARSIDLDLGAARTVGALYLGGVSSAVAFTATGGVGAHAEFNLGNLLAAPKRTAGAPYRNLLVIEPRELRYVRLSANVPAGFEVGLAMAGELFRPGYNHEWGAGRYLVDTSTVARNRAGGFGIDQGAIAVGWDFALGDLTDDDAANLFDMLRKVGESNPAIVCEDPDVTPGLEERTHYGLFQRLEKYERQSLGVTRWSLKIEEWI